MFSTVSIRNFQSLKRVDLELGRFTVIVGSSSCGKSAFMRALRTLITNVRGPSPYVTFGEKVFSISLSTDEYKIVLERGEGHGVYNITDLTTGKEELFTKLAGAVPPRISEVLRIDPVVDVPLLFATQGEAPYLLEDSGSQVARVLGELTNVSTIFEAVREANRRRQTYGSELKTRESDLAKAAAELQDFRDLPVRMTACTMAEKLLAVAQAKEAKILTLQKALNELEDAKAVLGRVNLPEVPTLASVMQLHGRLSDFKGVLGTWIQGQRKANEAEAEIQKWQTEEESLHDEIHTILVEAGECPTCGSVVKA